MPNYMLRLAFVGTNYSGWQIQPGVPTVQGAIKHSLERILGDNIKLTGCCRTDAGVHAQDYIANFLTEREIAEDKLLKAINSLLPEDIGVYEVSVVDSDFNSRYSVKGKTYLYKIWNSHSRNPFLHPFSWKVPYELDTDAMRESLSLISGRHNFKGFAKLEEEKNTEIELNADMQIKGRLIEIRFGASYFLRYMVRRLVGALVKVAEGKVSINDMEAFLKGEHCPHTAPAKGLTLEKVHL